MTFDLRPATDDDADFFIDMVIEAVNWLPDRHLTRADYDAAPDLRHYIDDWMRPTDIGVVATANEKPSSANDEPTSGNDEPSGARIGGCWLRFFDANDPSYGYVADDVPELSLAVVPEWRGRGVGRAMIRAAIEEARARGIDRVSLSVEDGNWAKALYDAEGFTDYEMVGNAYTMIVNLKS